MNELVLKVKKYDLYIYFSVFLFASSALYYWRITRYFYYLCVPILFVCIFLKYGRVFINNNVAFIILLLEAWITCSDFLNCNIVKENIFRLFSILSLVCLIDHNKGNPRFVICLRNGFVILSFLDIIFSLKDFLLGSTNDIGLLGHKNYHVLIYIVTLSLISICSKKVKYKNYFFLLFASITIAMTFALKSTTSLVCLFVYFLFSYLTEKDRLRFINLYTVLLVDGLVFYLIVYKQDVSITIARVVQALGKDVGFTGRNVMWSSAWKQVENMPLFGYGDNYLVPFYNSWNQQLSNHAHNLFLHLIVSGGWIYTCLFIALLILCAKNIQLSRSKIRFEVFILLACFLITGMSEIVINMNNCLLPLIFCTSCIMGRNMDGEYRRIINR